MIKLGILMDPIASINIKKDTTFAMLLEAQNRNYKIYYIELNDLYIDNGISYAHASLLNVQYNVKNWYKLDNKQNIPLAELHVILIRKDPPFNMEYIYATYILECAEKLGTLVFNKPQSLRDCNEKLYTIWFKNFIPNTLITRNKEKIHIFWKNNGNIVVKPLDGMGGKSVFFIKKTDLNFSVIIETLTQNGNIFCIAQNYLPAIKQGDKRVLVIDGEPIPYCLARIPKKGEIRGNLAAGGNGEVRLLTETDWHIAYNIGLVLKEKGLIFAGLDIIGDKLTEINITSPTGVCQIEKIYPMSSITKKLFDAIEQRLNLTK
ncbi:MAG: glutathione synthase [Pantoea sp. Brub]|nr:glutathione synthase [Pantoea sp. Brub]